ncbi:MAG: RNA polymerase sigma factor [bacterium]
MKNEPLGHLVEQAKHGSRAALEEMVGRIQDRIYGLALRMLWHPEDARDATQEILVKIITHLATFQGKSQFTTWVYRIACNYLLTVHKSRVEESAVSFEQFGRDLDDGLADEPFVAATSVEQTLLVEEVKIGCTLAMLLCLDGDHRIAYVLGEIFEVNSKEAGEILDISPEAFRKRLSRARGEIRAFMQQKCGIINSANKCHCDRRIDPAIKKGRLDRRNLLFTGPAVMVRARKTVQHHVQEMEELERIAALYRSHPDYAAPHGFLQHLEELIQSSRFDILS